MLSPSAITLHNRMPSTPQGNQVQLEGTLTDTFGSPEIQILTVETQYAAVTVHCACGDATSVTLTGFDETEAFCSCGRTAKVRVTVAPVAATGIQHSPESSPT